MSADAMIEELALKLKAAESAVERIAILDRYPKVKAFFCEGLDLEGEAALKQVIALGQAPSFFADVQSCEIAELARELAAVDSFYREIGGLAGYQMQVKKLLQKNADERANVQFHSPSFIDISSHSAEVERALEAGIDSMPELCEMYPLGGAADRLHLVDEKTGSDLPAAKLQFAGKTLLERLLCDLESRERLYFERTGRRIYTPVAIMTSHEKNNRKHVEEILESNGWFGRPKERFFLFIQPLVPVVDKNGDWIWTEPCKLLMKPGGHGAIWKLAVDNGVFDWFRSFGAKYALIRQINNPLAGLDYGLLAFAGLGVKKKMSFGFASCARACQAAEGVNVVMERRERDGYVYNLSNIEYCDFGKFGIEDVPIKQGEPFSRFTSNTNILFGNLNALEEVVRLCPFPGLLMNLKEDSKGRFVGRLESTMQNIADMFVEKKSEPLFEKKLNKTFITYNERSKTISTAKKAYIPGKSINETPEKCFFDLMSAARDLLQNDCGMTLPLKQSLEEMLSSYPSFVFLYHPCLGPFFKAIGKKICGGSLARGSELRLEIGDVAFKCLDLDGSLQVIAKENFFTRCVLTNCFVKNRGIDWKKSRPFWKGDAVREETVLIELGKKSKFIAENVRLIGSHHFKVPDGETMKVTQEGDALRISREV